MDGRTGERTARGGTWWLKGEREREENRWRRKKDGMEEEKDETSQLLSGFHSTQNVVHYPLNETECTQNLVLNRYRAFSQRWGSLSLRSEGGHPLETTVGCKYSIIGCRVPNTKIAESRKKSYTGRMRMEEGRQFLSSSLSLSLFLLEPALPASLASCSTDRQPQGVKEGAFLANAGAAGEIQSRCMLKLHLTNQRTRDDEG